MTTRNRRIMHITENKLYFWSIGLNFFRIEQDYKKMFPIPYLPSGDSDEMGLFIDVILELSTDTELGWAAYY